MHTFYSIASGASRSVRGSRNLPCESPKFGLGTCLESGVGLKGSHKSSPKPQHQRSNGTCNRSNNKQSSIVMTAMMDLQLSQRIEDHGIADTYLVVVSTASDELVHEFCAYSSAYGGPVRPDPVTGLRAEQIDKGRATVKWEWSENSFELAAPGAYFERDVILDPLAWAGDGGETPQA